MGNANSGPNTKFNQTVGNAIVALYKENKTDKQVCEALGISTRTLYLWRHKHEDLVEQIAKSRSIADDLVVATLFQKAMGVSVPETKVFLHEGEIIEHEITKHYAPDTTSIIFWLKNRRPDEWKDRVEVMGDGYNHIVKPKKDFDDSK